MRPADSTLSHRVEQDPACLQACHLPAQDTPSSSWSRGCCGSGHSACCPPPCTPSHSAAAEVLTAGGPAAAGHGHPVCQPQLGALARRQAAAVAAAAAGLRRAPRLCTRCPGRPRRRRRGRRRARADARRASKRRGGRACPRRRPLPQGRGRAGPRGGAGAAAGGCRTREPQGRAGVGPWRKRRQRRARGSRRVPRAACRAGPPRGCGHRCRARPRQRHRGPWAGGGRRERALLRLCGRQR